eukprot:IDg19819t1
MAPISSPTSSLPAQCAGSDPKCTQANMMKLPEEEAPLATPNEDPRHPIRESHGRAFESDPANRILLIGATYTSARETNNFFSPLSPCMYTATHLWTYPSTSRPSSDSMTYARHTRSDEWVSGPLQLKLRDVVLD